MAHEHTLVEGIGPNASVPVPVVFDLTMPQGFNLVKAVPIISFFDPQMRFGAPPKEPVEWVYQS